MKEKLKQREGITLIALIITIIILLILAMVSVKLIANGEIITHAKKATSNYKVEEEKEKIQLAYSNYKASKYNKTEDKVMLEGYFLGKNIETLIDSDESTDEQIVFKDINITITNNDIVASEDGKELYVYFIYNGYRYRLIVNSENSETRELEGELEENISLEVEGAEVKGNEIIGWNIRFKETGNRYPLTPEGVIGEPEKTIELAEGSLANAYVEGKLKIGDKVAYAPETGKSITVEKEKSGASKSITLSTDQYNLTWRVMDVNDATGVVTLIASNSIKIFSYSEDYLVSGKAGYNNGPNVLNELCSIFGTGEGATGARSLTVEDINKVFKFDKTKYEDPNNGNVYDNPVLNRKYGYKTTYYAEKTTWNPEDTYQYKDGRKEYIRTGDDKVFKDIEGNVATDQKPITITSNLYYYDRFLNNIEEEIMKMMLGGINYKMDTLLASQFVETRVNEAYWGVYAVYLGRVYGAPLYWSNKTGEVKSNTVQSIRPVVTLQANILGEKDVNGVWQFK